MAVGDVPTVTISTGVSAPGLNIGAPTTQFANATTPSTIVPGTGPTVSVPGVGDVGVTIVAPVGTPPPAFATESNIVVGLPNPTPPNIPPAQPAAPGTVTQVTPAVVQNNIAVPNQFGP